MRKKSDRLMLATVLALLAIVYGANRKSSHPHQDITSGCDTVAAGNVAGVTVWKTRDGKSFFYQAGLMIDADGAPNAYHPAGRGSDYLSNAGRPGRWWALATDDGLPGGNPLIQGSQDPFPGYYVSTTALADESRRRSDPARYVDSNIIPYFVLPTGSDFGARLGDLGVVVNTKNERVAYAIYADVGPAHKIGEGSIALADALGIHSSPKSGGVQSGIVFIVFPGSGAGVPLTRPEIEIQASRLFQEWGGRARLKTCLEE